MAKIKDKKIRIALCLNGKVGNIRSKSGGQFTRNGHKMDIGEESGMIVLDLAYKHWYENLLRRYTVDVFVWSWDVNLEEHITKVFNPVKQSYSKQIDFWSKKRKQLWRPKGEAERSRVQNTYSRYYSLWKCVELKTQYELRNKFKYDVVLCSRFDLALTTPINLITPIKELTITKPLNTLMKSSIFGNGGIAWQRTRHIKCSDSYFFSTSDNMNRFSQLYHYIDELSKEDRTRGGHNISSHRLANHWIKRILGLRWIDATIETDKELASAKQAPIIRELYFNWHRRRKNINVNPTQGRMFKIELTPNIADWETFDIKGIKHEKIVFPAKYKPTKKEKQIENFGREMSSEELNETNKISKRANKSINKLNIKRHNEKF